MVCRNFRTLYIGESSRFSDFDDASSGTSRRAACQFASESIRCSGNPDLYYRKYFTHSVYPAVYQEDLKWMKKIKCFRGLIEKLENRAMGRSEKIQQYEFWGLVLFVGIPLPGTGAWTGALIASLLGIDIKKSSLAILCGIAMATVIMYVVSYVLVGNIVS